jgi:hypothetical protein
MRNEYYKFISENKINDTFIYIPEISYSYKLLTLKSLKEIYTNEQINIALNEYELNYIRKNRVDIKKLYNTLKGIIDRSNK